LTPGQLSDVVGVLFLSSMALSRRSKLLFILIGASLALIAIVLIAALTPAVQTFAARKVLAGQGGEVERVSVGLGGASLAGLRLAQPGLTVSVPSFRADVPLMAAAHTTTRRMRFANSRVAH
jgi:hypothetical protein